MRVLAEIDAPGLYGDDASLDRDLADIGDSAIEAKNLAVRLSDDGDAVLVAIHALEVSLRQAVQEGVQEMFLLETIQFETKTFLRGTETLGISRVKLVKRVDFEKTRAVVGLQQISHAVQVQLVNFAVFRSSGIQEVALVIEDRLHLGDSRMIKGQQFGRSTLIVNQRGQLLDCRTKRDQSR